MSVHVNYANGSFNHEDSSEAHGHVCIPGALLHASNLNNDSKILWQFLQHYAQQKSECWPSMETLRTEMQCSENTIRVAMQKLVTAGFVTVKHRGRGLSNVYSMPDIRTAKSEVLETQELNSRGPRNATVEVPEPQKTAHEEVIREEVTKEEKEVEEQPIVERVLVKLRRAFPVVVDEAKWKPQSYANLIERFPLLDHLWNVQELCDYADRNPDWMKKTKDPAGRMRTWFTKADADRAEPRMNGKTTTNGRSHVKVVGTNTQKGPADGTHRVPQWAQDNTKRNLAKLAADYEARHGGPSAAAQ